MKKLTLAFAVFALALATPGVALASTSASSHHGGDDMDMGGHGDGHGGGNAPTVDDAREIQVKAGRLRFSPKAITVAAGEDVTIALTSTDTFHDFVVKGTGHVVGAKRKKTAEGGLRIDEPGTYKFWCSVSGHRAAGMKGTIVVE